MEDIEKLALKVHERFAKNKRQQTAGQNIVPVSQNLDASDYKHSSPKRRRPNRYRLGQQFLSTSSSRHKLNETGGSY